MSIDTRILGCPITLAAPVFITYIGAPDRDRSGKWRNLQEESAEIKGPKTLRKVGLRNAHGKRVSRASPSRIRLMEAVDQDLLPLKAFLHTLLASWWTLCHKVRTRA